MNRKQRRTMESFRRVSSYLSAPPAALDPVSLVPLREELAQITERLAAQAVTQDAADRMRLAGTRRLNALTRVLRRKHMKPIARLSQTHLPDVVGATEALWLPREDIDAAKLVIAAEAMAEAAAPYAESFAAKSGFPADFISQLRAAAQQVSDAIAMRHEEKRRRAGATESVWKDIARGRSIVRLLDAIVTPPLEEQDGLLREWQLARKVAVARSPSVENEPAVVLEAKAA